MDFDHILNWELKAGSHEFPGPAGGTCINEAAIVAAGLPYREVARPMDLPQCFSRVLGAALIVVNDMASDEDRQELMEFVTMLAGTRGTLEEERARASSIANEFYHRVWKKMGAVYTLGADAVGIVKTAPAMLPSQEMLYLTAALQISVAPDLQSVLSGLSIVLRGACGGEAWSTDTFRLAVSAVRRALVGPRGRLDSADGPQNTAAFSKEYAPA